jgi:hypothetical protein
MSAFNFVNKVAAMSVSAWPFPKPTFETTFVANKSVSVVNTIKYVHAISETGRGGVTIAYRKCSDTRNSRMVEVAVAYCSPADAFSKKVGHALATKAFLDGRTILVPARSNKEDESIPHNLRAMFWYATN